MPIYEFRCDCGHQFEKLCRMSDDAVQPCPQCGGDAKKILSVFQTTRSSGSFGGTDSFAAGPECGG